MRLLINIFHEYLIYKEILQKNKLNQTELFAIVTYKNLFPSDFANLHKRKGKLYEFFSKKGDYIQENLNEKKNQITNLRERIKEIDKEKISDIEELRMIYVQKLVNRLFQQNNQGNYIQTTFWVENTNINFHNVTNNDQDFTRLLNAGTVQTHMNNGSRLSSSFTNQEKEEYIARGSLIKGKADNEVNEHKQEIEKLNKEINEIKLEKIKDIFKSPDVDQHIHEDLRKPLIRYLITKGYINENYHDYISLFHAVTMSRTDDAFLRHIKSLSSLEFSYRLDRVNEIIKRIEEDYFQTEIVQELRETPVALRM